MSAEQRQVLELFEKPFRGGEGTITFPTETSVGTRIAGGPTITTRFGGFGPVTPDLGYATAIPRGRIFSMFVRTHRRAAKSLCDYFMRANSVGELVTLANRSRNLVNEQLFIYCLSYVIIRKPAMRGVRVPTIVETFPNKYASQEMLQRAQEQMKMNPSRREPIVIDQEFSGTLIKAEHRVSYWREDYGLNSHHWHWHLVFPIEVGANKDRKGEIFYYMHQQMLARYDMERLSNGLNRVIPLTSLRDTITDGYFSKLTINNSGRAWGNRQDNTKLSDVRRDDFGLGFVNLSDLELYFSRVMDAIHLGYMIDRDGNRVPLTDDPPNNGKRGIDILGDAFEADAEISVNYPFYGDWHNLTHLVISFAHDPDFAHKEEISVIGDPNTSMRDPVFYRMHKTVDEVFNEYKLQQRPYTEQELDLPGIVVSKLGVLQEGVPNNLKTGWNQREFDAGRGLDFGQGSPSISLRFTHLDHKEFTYVFSILNNLSTDKEVTVRIFMAPTLDERGNKMNFMDQRLLWAEMDKFVLTLRPGENTQSRSSMNSSITGPVETTFRELETGTAIETGSAEGLQFGQCGCGWPQHLLLPKGQPGGMDYQLLMMVTDYALDRVEEVSRSRACSNAVSYCGILDSKFPDRRPMGFPFDRRHPEEIKGNTVQTAEEFVDQFDNMLISDLKITFTDARI